MSLNLVTFSNDEISPKKKVVVRIRKKRLKTKEVVQNSEEIEEKEPEKRADTFILPRLVGTKNGEVRFLNETKNKKQPFPKKDNFFTCKVERECVTKINGTRLYFHYSDNNPEHNLIAKAKHKNSSEIPISLGNEIHLSSGSFLAKIISKNHQSMFSLVKDDGAPLLDVQFMQPRANDTFSRRTLVFFYPNDLFDDFSIESKNLCDVPDFGKLYRLISIKNALLGPADEDTCLISVRKTSKNAIEIDSILDIPNIHLFAIGIAAFLGKLPPIN